MFASRDYSSQRKTRFFEGRPELEVRCASRPPVKTITNRSINARVGSSDPVNTVSTRISVPSGRIALRQRLRISTAASSFQS